MSFEDYDLFVAEWSGNVRQTYELLLPVLLNMGMVLFGWCVVYGMETDPSSLVFLLRDGDSSLTDGIMNGVMCAVFVAILSFVMVLLAFYKMKTIIQYWLTSSALLIMFVVSFQYFESALKLIGVANAPFAVGLSLVYGVIGSLAYLTDRLPPRFHQFYVISNCSLVSMFYLKVLPDATAWSLLSIIVLWDIFAVLTPFGPLKQVTGFAQDYGEDILRFLMFSTGQAEQQDEQEDEEEPHELPGDDQEQLSGDGQGETEEEETESSAEEEEDEETLKRRFYSSLFADDELQQNVPLHQPLCNQQESVVSCAEAEELLQKEDAHSRLLDELFGKPQCEQAAHSLCEPEPSEPDEAQKMQLANSMLEQLCEDDWDKFSDFSGGEDEQLAREDDGTHTANSFRARGRGSFGSLEETVCQEQQDTFEDARPEQFVEREGEGFEEDYSFKSANHPLNRNIAEEESGSEVLLTFDEVSTVDQHDSEDSVDEDQPVSTAKSFDDDLERMADVRGCTNDLVHVVGNFERVNEQLEQLFELNRQEERVLDDLENMMNKAEAELVEIMDGRNMAGSDDHLQQQQHCVEDDDDGDSLLNSIYQSVDKGNMEDAQLENALNQDLAEAGEQLSEASEEEAGRTSAGQDCEESEDDPMVDWLYESIMVNRPELAEAIEQQDQEREQAAEEDQPKSRLKPNVDEEDEEEEEESDDDQYVECEEIKAPPAPKKPKKKTALEALNDSSARLGMGDFVFYGLLVGKSAAAGCPVATLAALVGVLVGLVITLTLLTDGDETTPALPVSVVLGMALHFGCLHMAVPFAQSAAEVTPLFLI